MTASARHVSIFAITGGGRTNAAQVLLLGLFQARLPFLVVDWKRSHRSRLTLPLPEVRTLRFYSVGRKTSSPFNGNPLRPPPGRPSQDLDQRGGRSAGAQPHLRSRLCLTESLLRCSRRWFVARGGHPE